MASSGRKDSATGNDSKPAPTRRQASQNTSPPPTKRVRFASPTADTTHAPLPFHPRASPSPSSQAAPPPRSTLKSPEPSQRRPPQHILDAQIRTTNEEIVALLTQRRTGLTGLAAQPTFQGIGSYSHIAGPIIPPRGPGEKATRGPPVFLPWDYGIRSSSSASTPRPYEPVDPNVRRVYEEMCEASKREERRLAGASSGTAVAPTTDPILQHGGLPAPVPRPAAATPAPAARDMRESRLIQWYEPVHAPLNVWERGVVQRDPDQGGNKVRTARYYNVERDPRVGRAHYYYAKRDPLKLALLQEVIAPRYEPQEEED